jgi:hypothetical protein
MEYTYNNYDYDEIIPNLFIGNINSLKHANKFDFILNCTDDIPFPKTCTNCLRISIKDDPDESDRLLHLLRKYSILEKIYGYIQSKKSVLVHCYAGMQRSCAVVACYLIKNYSISPYTAISHIKMKRNVAFYRGVNFQNALDKCYNENKVIKSQSLEN